jgi:Papain-like cysteine protease AvrRpt2
MKMRRLYSILLFFLPNLLISQNCTPLRVTPIPQKGSNWCWAACMEMIIKFHKPTSTVTQCNLATSIKDPNVFPKKCSVKPSCKNCTICNECTTWNNIHRNCDNTLINTDEFVTNFNRNGFNASNPSDFNFITFRDEICVYKRPLIGMLKTQNDNCRSSHAVVVKSTFSSGGNNFVVCINPNKKMCFADDDTINYISTSVLRFCSIVNSITPTSGSILAIRSASSNDTFFEKSQQIYEDSIIGKDGIYTTLSQTEFNKLLSGDNILYRPLRYLSYNKLLDLKQDSLTIGSSAINEELYEVISLKAPYVTTTFQLIDGQRVPIKISKLYSNPVDFIKKIELSRTELSKLDNGNCKLKGYESFEVPLFPYKFVRFCQNDVYYSVPMGDYILANETIKEGTIYKQSEILRLLKKQVRLDNNNYLRSSNDQNLKLNSKKN